MFWKRANSIDNQIKTRVIERSGGYCECSLPEHHHASGRCGNPLGLHHHYLSQHLGKDNELMDVIVLCPACYKAVIAAAHKKS